MWRGKKLHSQQTAAPNIQNFGISLPEATTTQVTKEFYQLQTICLLPARDRSFLPSRLSNNTNNTGNGTSVVKVF
jgi:hypothetical protein